MDVQTLTAIVGTEACNASCPFCVSKMTLALGTPAVRPVEVNWDRWYAACRLAQVSRATTVLFTGKGEPTIFPEQLTKYLEVMQPFDFPIIELQTNGILIAQRPEHYVPHMQRWYDLKMKTIAVSIVHYEPERNREIYLPNQSSYIDLPELIRTLHKFFSVRLTCIMASGYIDSPDLLQNLVNFAKKNKVEQLTVTPVNKPDADVRNPSVWKWTDEHHLSDEQFGSIVQYVEKNGSHIRTLLHGAKVFDIGGQNLCINNCLSVDPDNEALRNLIFFPDGHVRTHWQFPGSIIF